MSEQALRLLREQRERLIADQKELTRWLFDTLTKRTDVAAGYGLDVKRSRRLLERATERMENDEHKRAMDELREGLAFIEEEIGRGAEGLLLEQKVLGLIRRGENCNVDTRRYVKLLEQAGAAGTGTSKLYYLRQALADLERDVEVHEEVFRLVGGVSAGIAALEEAGKDPSKARELLERAKMASQPESALHFLERSLEALKDR